MNGFTLGTKDNIKEIRFDHNGRRNERQIQYFEAIFDKDLKLRGLYDEFVYFGAFRCSKSFSQQLVVYLICLLYPNTKAVFIRDTYDQLKDSVIKQFLDEYEGLGAFDYKISERVAQFKNGSELRFRTFERDTNILSAEYDLIAVCQAEDIQIDLFLQLVGRASGRVLGSKGIILCEGNPGSGWVKERYKDQTKESLQKKRIFFIEGQTQDNPHVTQAYIQSLIDNYPKFWLDRYLYGLWDNREELIFSEFNEKSHIIEPIDPKTIPNDYVRRVGLDWGWVNPTAALHSFVDYDGNLIIYDEFYTNKTLPEDVAKEVNKYGAFVTVADHAMKGLKMPTRDDENITVWSELERNKVKLVECNKEELSNIVLGNTLFKQGKIYITSNCVNFLREIRNWKWKKWKLGADKNMPEEPVDKDNHTCDCFDYLIAELFGTKAHDRTKEKVLKESLYQQVIKKTNDLKITQLS